MAAETKMDVSFWERFTDSIGAFSEKVVGFLGRLFGSSNERYVRNLGYLPSRNPDVTHSVVSGSLLAQVNDLEPFMRALPDEAIKELTTQFRECLAGTFRPRRYVKKQVPVPQTEAESVDDVPPDPDFILRLLPPEQAETYTAADGEEVVEDPLGLSQVRSPATLEDLLPYAFAACREA